jgi:hypothetical protein
LAKILIQSIELRISYDSGSENMVIHEVIIEEFRENAEHVLLGGFFSRRTDGRPSPTRSFWALPAQDFRIAES